MVMSANDAYSMYSRPTLTPGGSTQAQNGGSTAPQYLQYQNRLPKPSITPATGGPMVQPAVPGANAPPPSGVQNNFGLGGSGPNLLSNNPNAIAGAPSQPSSPQNMGSPPPQAQGGPAAAGTAPVNPAPNQAGQGSDALANLGDVLSNHLANPSRFDLPEVKKAYDFFSQDLKDQARLAGSNAITDASARGVYYGSPLTTSLGDINTQLQRGLGALSTNIGLEQAQTQGQDLSNAIGQGMQFGQLGMQGQQNAFNNALNMAQFGEGGMPTMTGAIGAQSP